MSYNVFDAADVMFHFIIATSDTHYAVVQVAELHIKRIVSVVDVNENAIVNKFYSLFLGDNTALKKMTVRNYFDENLAKLLSLS